MSEPTLDELISDFKALPFSGHAHAIGHLCIQWSFLESTLGLALAIFADLKDPKTRPAIIHNTNMRDKVRMLDAMGFVVRPDDDWYEQLKAALKCIDNELRPKRNRMAHDQWTSDGQAIVRTTQMAKVIKEQARQYAFQTEDPKPVPEAEVWELVALVCAQKNYITDLIVDWLNAQLEA